MKSYQATTTINASAEAVWQALTDAGQFATWNPGVVRLEGRIAPGETVTLYRTETPKVSAARVTTFEPGRRLTFTGSGGMPEFMLEVVQSYTITPRNDGAVDLLQQLTISGLMADTLAGAIPDQGPVFAEAGAMLKQRVEQPGASPAMS
jgi:uncharacterized protein YndB with AHSA1/START domain